MLARLGRLWSGWIWPALAALAGLGIVVLRFMARRAGRADAKAEAARDERRRFRSGADAAADEGRAVEDLEDEEVRARIRDRDAKWRDG